MHSGRINIVHILFTAATLALLSVCGYYYAREGMAKWAFAHQACFEANELVLITVARTDLNTQTAYLVNEDEFEWQGQLVDVLYREVRSDTVYVYGFRDEDETKLKQKASGLYVDTARLHKSTSTQTKRVRRDTSIYSPFQAIFGSATTVIWLEARVAFLYLSSRLSFPHREVLGPPPNE